MTKHPKRMVARGRRGQRGGAQFQMELNRLADLHQIQASPIQKVAMLETRMRMSPHHFIVMGKDFYFKIH
jgi:hypothetical protein